MDNKYIDEATKLLKKSIKENGLFTTLKAAFGKDIRFRIKISSDLKEKSIDEIDFSTRVRNGFHRSGIKTIGDVVKVLEKGSIRGLHNLGVSSDNEVKSRLIKLAWSRMDDYEKDEFCRQIVIDNTIV